MLNIRVCLLSILLLLPISSQAVEIEGVSLPDSINLENKTLLLNGAGIRSKFFFDIYVAGLYLEAKSSSADEIISNNTVKRISMDFLYDEVTKEKLTDGWNTGFSKNQSKPQMQALQERLDQFNSYFSSAHKGDRIIFDFLGNGATQVTINDKLAGTVEGADFQQALVAVWLGNKPADKDLKASLLGR
ncbi:chalcone-flavanone isomerase [Mariprofundus micogutta]|uniref:Chalcone-flavanone isomerase n=1 Tax=Mariprofundus micogutta TaxID=1921010 RepID=A0A1L8CRC2_9PROT|nr:chalcone isomerase family protein [Mariprofundus micogutta]GAV21369.1 chalcone-flavanone isomerase [Mariprofundus micogutta]